MNRLPRMPAAKHSCVERKGHAESSTGPEIGRVTKHQSAASCGHSVASGRAVACDGSNAEVVGAGRIVPGDSIVRVFDESGVRRSAGSWSAPANSDRERRLDDSMAPRIHFALTLLWSWGHAHGSTGECVRSAGRALCRGARADPC
jgi:hypothetical protein